jgi:hypothetical protein
MNFDKAQVNWAGRVVASPKSKSGPNSAAADCLIISATSSVQSLLNRLIKYDCDNPSTRGKRVEQLPNMNQKFLSNATSLAPTDV